MSSKKFDEYLIEDIINNIKGERSKGKEITDEELEEYYDEDDINEARRRIQAEADRKANSSSAPTTTTTTTKPKAPPKDDERKEDSSSEWSGDSSSDSSSDDEDDNQKQQAEAQAELEDLKDDSTYDSEVDSDGELDEEAERELIKKMGFDKKYSNDTIMNNRRAVVAHQVTIMSDAPSVVKPVLQMMMRNGISNAWIPKYNTDSDLNDIILEAVMRKKIGDDDYRLFRTFECQYNAPMALQKTLQSEVKNQWLAKKNVKLYTVQIPGHIMAMVEWTESTDKVHQWLFDSNGSGSKCLDSFMKTFPNGKLIKEFRPHKSEFGSTFAENIFIGPKGRCASWTIFILLCFKPVLHMKKGRDLDELMFAIRQFLIQFNGEKARVMSTLIVGLYTRLHLWSPKIPWFDKFTNTAQQVFLMPKTLGLREPEVTKLWKQVKEWKAYVKDNTKEWLKRDVFGSSHYHKMFGYPTKKASVTPQTLYNIIKQIVKGGVVNMITASRGKGTTLMLRMPTAEQFWPFDYTTDFSQVDLRTGEIRKSESNDRFKDTILKFVINHQNIERTTGKDIRNIVWGDVLEYIKNKINENAEFWKKVNEATEFDATKMFHFNDDRSVSYSQFNSGLDENDEWSPQEKFQKNQIPNPNKFALSQSDKQEDWILHVQQDTVYRRLDFKHSDSLDNNNWPVLRNEEFPFSFNSKMKDIKDMMGFNPDRKGIKQQEFTRNNIIYLTFDHGWSNRMVKAGGIYQVNGRIVENIKTGKEYQNIAGHRSAGAHFDDIMTGFKLVNFYRWSEHVYQNYEGEEHILKSYYEQVRYFPHSIRLVVKNKEGVPLHWVQFNRVVFGYSRQHQLVLLSALKQAANSQYNRRGLALRFNKADNYRTKLHQEKTNKESTLTYPKWNVATLEDETYRLQSSRSVQLFNFTYNVNDPNKVVTPYGAIDTTPNKNHRFIPLRAFLSTYKPQPKYKEGTVLQGGVNFVWQGDNDQWERKFHQADNYLAYRMWVSVLVTGVPKKVSWGGWDPEKNMDNPERDVPVGGKRLFRPPEWYTKLRWKTLDIPPSNNIPFRVETLKNGPRARWVLKGKYGVKSDKFSTGDPYKPIEKAEWRSENAEYKKIITSFYKAEFLEKDFHITVPSDWLQKVKKKKKKVKKKKKKVEKDNNGNPVIDLTGDDDGGSSSSIGKKRKKPGLVEALDFPQLKL